MVMDDGFNEQHREMAHKKKVSVDSIGCTINRFRTGDGIFEGYLGYLGLISWLKGETRGQEEQVREDCSYSCPLVLPY